MSASRTARCPQCSTPAQLDASNPFRPFCCERCKLLDFGAWAEGRYAIPAVEDDSDADDMGPASTPPSLQ